MAPRAQFHTARTLRAQQDYGSGDGNPAGENPQQQGKRGREDLEHPGPPPPKVGQNNKTSPDASSSSSGSGQQSSKTQSSEGGKSQSEAATNKDAKGVKGAQPKILNENPPTEKNAPEEVKEHNREVDQRAERANEQVSNEDAEKDKVPKSFWAGE